MDPHSAHGMVRIYTMRFYFVSTVFTTVGFGDISASNSQEHIFIVCLMLLGLLVFAATVGDSRNAPAGVYTHIHIFMSVIFSLPLKSHDRAFALQRFYAKGRGKWGKG